MPTWIKFFLIGLILLLLGVKATAKKVLANLDLSKGSWEMVAVKLYNYQMLPIQQELGTFLLNDLNALKDIQSTWGGEPVYDDYCDYHYAVKFYCNKKLVKTLKINLVCGYITEDVLSYEFSEALFTTHRKLFIRQPWCRVTYKNLERLRFAVDKLQKSQIAFLYEDVTPYRYDGFFVLGIDGLPWYVSRDSVKSVVEADLIKRLGHNRWHVVPYIFFLNEKWELSFRFFVYCNEEAGVQFANRGGYVTASWRSHFAFKDEDDKHIQLVIVGVNREKYYELVPKDDYN